MSKTGNQVYLHLFHGRKTVTEDIEDWGTDGPTFGPLAYVHTTYAGTIHLGMADDDNVDLEVDTDNDLVFYDGIWYGDWSVYGPDPDPVTPEMPDDRKAGTWIPPRKET